MPFSGVSKVTKTGSLPATAPCQAALLLRMLPGLLLTMPRVGAARAVNDRNRHACASSVVARGLRAMSAHPIADRAAGEETAEAGGDDEATAEEPVLDDVTQRRQLGAQFRDLFHDDAPETKRRAPRRASGIAGSG